MNLDMHDWNWTECWDYTLGLWTLFWIYLGFILDSPWILVSWYLVFNWDSLHLIKSGWCLLWACYNNTGWTNSWFHSKISSWFKCQVVCWKLATGVTTVTVTLCDCHSVLWLSPPVTVTCDRWNNETVGQFLVLDLWTPEEWKTNSKRVGLTRFKLLLTAVNCFKRL